MASHVDPDEHDVTIPLTTTSLEATSFASSPPALSLHCPFCSTNASTKRGRWKVFKLGKGLRTHASVKHRQQYESMVCRSPPEAVESWVQCWFTKVNNTRRFSPMGPPPGTMRQLLDTLEMMAPSFVAGTEPVRNEIEDLARSGLGRVKAELEGKSDQQVGLALSREDHHGTTLLHWAAGLGDLKLFKYLHGFSFVDDINSNNGKSSSVGGGRGRGGGGGGGGGGRNKRQGKVRRPP